MIFIIGSVFLILVVGFTYIIERRKMKRFKNEMIIFKNIKEKSLKYREIISDNYGKM